MAAPPYQKWFWGSYHKHTSHLDHAREHGAYFLLIGALWNNGGKLSTDDAMLAAYAKLTPKEWAAMKPKLMPMFAIRRGVLTHLRVTEDLAKYRATSGKRKEAGKAGGQASAGKHSGKRKAIATGLPTKPEPEPKNKTPNPPDGGRASSIFDQAWGAYPLAGRSNRGPDRARACWTEAAARAGGEAALLAAVQAHAARLAADPRQAAKDFARWLRDDGFVAYLAASGDPSHRWTGPQEVWDVVAKAMTPAFANSWLGASTWQPDPPAVISPTTAYRRLTDAVGPVLSGEGIQLLERAA